MMKIKLPSALLAFCVTASGLSAAPLTHQPNETIVFVGNGLGSRMMQHGHVESEIFIRHRESDLTIRNLCDEVNTPAFWPHSARTNPWGFPGADKFVEKHNEIDKLGTAQMGRGNENSPDKWLQELAPDTIFAFYGFNESFRGPEGVASYKEELSAYLKHLQGSKFKGKTPQIVLFSPIAFQDVSKIYNTPVGTEQNANLKLYTAAMKEVADALQVRFVDLYQPTAEWFKGEEVLTVDGASLNEAGYKKLGSLIAQSLYGDAKFTSSEFEALRKLVDDKNWVWHNDYKIPNGVHVYGTRHKPYGPQNYPDERKKLREMVINRDKAIHAYLRGKDFDLAAADAATHPLPPVKTSFKREPSGYLYGDEAVKSIVTPENYKVELFASEKEFPLLENPVQISFDNQGRLWVAVMPTYPHWKPGDPRPDDKILIFEDTNGDGKADKQTVFADGLHLPIGFEIAPEGVYCAQLPHLVLLKDTDGDGKADSREILLSGFDDHDTHHAISAFCADPSGAIYMCEGTFLHSNIETPNGPSRNYGGGFFRYDPRTRSLEKSARLGVPNPWGVAVDDWGQNFFIVATNFHWMKPGTVKTNYGQFAPMPQALISKKNMVRPSSGVEIMSSRHFPDEVQGDVMIGNTIGYLGIKQHRLEEDGTGFKITAQTNLLYSKDENFRPVDLEIAPDGSLFVIDWHNVLIGHMQHNARDPLRDHDHGRIYRVTYPSRPLVKPAHIAGAPLATLFENLKLPESRSRYRTRRELRGRDAAEVIPALKQWVGKLDKNEATYDHHMLEALWVSWGAGRIDQDYLTTCLNSKDHRARAAAINVLRYSGTQIANKAELLKQAAADAHSRVRLEAIIAASWMTAEDGLPILDIAAKQLTDDTLKATHQVALTNLKGGKLKLEEEKLVIPKHLVGDDRKKYQRGHGLYIMEGNCGTCHQEDGEGLPDAQFPPLAGSEWVTGNKDRLIKITLHGLHGPIEVKGVKYPGAVPMTAFKHMSDNEIADVLTYVRNSFGNKASSVTPDEVSKVRAATKNVESFLNPEELLKEHPHE